MPQVTDTAPTAATARGADDCQAPHRDAGTLDALSSTLLLAGRDAVRIEHLGQCYVLRATRAGKLILTK